MTDRRIEAQDPATSPERLHELAHLPGDRGDIDSDSGWCREYVAANRNAPLATLQELAADRDDFMCRLNAAKNPSLDIRTVWMMIEDENEMVADAARERLGLTPKPRPVTYFRPVNIPRIDPKSGRIIP